MGLSLSHLVIILVIVMVIYGPSRLGGLGRGIGEAIRGFKKGMNGDDSIDVTHTIQNQPNDQIRDASAHHDPTQTTNTKDRNRS